MYLQILRMELKETRTTKGGRETKGHLEKDCWVGEKRGNMEDLERSEGGSTEERVLVREHVSLLHFHSDLLFKPTTVD